MAEYRHNVGSPRSDEHRTFKKTRTRTAPSVGATTQRPKSSDTLRRIGAIATAKFATESAATSARVATEFFGQPRTPAPARHPIRAAQRRKTRGRGERQPHEGATSCETGCQCRPVHQRWLLQVCESPTTTTTGGRAPTGPAPPLHAQLRIPSISAANNRSLICRRFPSCRIFLPFYFCVAYLHWDSKWLKSGGKILNCCKGDLRLY